MFDGPVVPLAIKIGTPMLVGGVVQFSYALIDTWFISRIDSLFDRDPLGYRPHVPALLLFMALSQSISIGVASLVGRSSAATTGPGTAHHSERHAQLLAISVRQSV